MHLTKHDALQLEIVEDALGPREPLLSSPAPPSFGRNKTIPTLKELEAKPWYPLAHGSTEAIEFHTNPELPGIYCVRSALPGKGELRLRAIPDNASILHRPIEHREPLLQAFINTCHDNSGTRLQAVRIEIAAESCLLQRSTSQRDRFDIAVLFLRPPIHEWLADSQDPWLVGTLPALFETQAPWSFAVAVGRYGRLRQESPKRIQAILTAHISGEKDTRESRASSWAQRLSRPQHKILTTFAHQEIAHLQEALLKGDKMADYKNPAWRAGVVSWLIQRDDLTSVLSLLRLGEPKELKELDHAAQVILGAYPTLPEIASSLQLARARRYDDQAWWAHPQG